MLTGTKFCRNYKELETFDSDNFVFEEQRLFELKIKHVRLYFLISELLPEEDQNSGRKM